ncbi:MAG: zinc-ribbon domain-containing protein [SAR324 cluster bacterium]|nr:zinc-ribbon domain-containing protein [SAR324 cluster bacterium]
MVIQCTSCNTKFRLNLETIPDRRAFVKCRNCGTPIFVDPPEDAAEEWETASGTEAPTAAPPTPAGGNGERQAVTCRACGTRYRLPAEALSRPGVRLKCTHCGNLFALGDDEAAAPPVSGKVAGAAVPAGRDFYPGAQEDVAGGAAGGLDRPMPIPDDAAVEGMLDDFREQATPFAEKEASAHGPGPSETGGLFSANLDDIGAGAPESAEAPAEDFDPERAYLEATAIDDGNFSRLRRSQGTVPDQYKYRFFLKPERGPESQPEETLGSHDAAPVADPNEPEPPPEQAQPEADLAAGGEELTYPGSEPGAEAPESPGEPEAVPDPDDLDPDIELDEDYPAPAMPELETPAAAEAPSGPDSPGEPQAPGKPEAAPDLDQVVPAVEEQAGVDELLREHGIGDGALEDGALPSIHEERTLGGGSMPAGSRKQGFARRLVPWLWAAAATVALVLLFFAGYAVAAGW